MWITLDLPKVIYATLLPIFGLRAGVQNVSCSHVGEHLYFISTVYIPLYTMQAQAGTTASFWLKQLIIRWTPWQLVAFSPSEVRLDPDCNRSSRFLGLAARLRHHSSEASNWPIDPACLLEISACGWRQRTLLHCEHGMLLLLGTWPWQLTGQTARRHHNKPTIFYFLFS
jgi:hypothetical protein